MSPRLLLLSLAPLFATATAHAQAPGAYAPEAAPSYATPPPAMPVAAPAVRKWSLGVSMGHLELSPNDYPDQSAQFGLGQLAVRYRGWRHLELELAFGGGHQKLEDGNDGELAVATGTLAARYRFNPAQAWNWWLLAGLGATTVAPRTASDEEVSAAQRPHGTVGVGLERRFDRFALQVEARMMAVGQTEAEKMYQVDGMTTGLSGGSMTLGASYYF